MFLTNLTSNNLFYYLKSVKFRIMNKLFEKISCEYYPANKDMNPSQLAIGITTQSASIYSHAMQSNFSFPERSPVF